MPDYDYPGNALELFFSEGIDQDAAKQSVLSIGWKVNSVFTDGDGPVRVEASFPSALNIYEAYDQAFSELPLSDIRFSSAARPANVPTWERLWGVDALETMAYINGARYGACSNWDIGGTVVLATTSGYWDALSASALAGAYNAPIVLTDPDELLFPTRGRLAAYKPTRVVIAGGEGAVSRHVEAQVRLCIDAEVVRVAGWDALDTSRLFCEKLDATGGEFIIASSTTYHDALSIAPYAYANHVPVLLTDAEGRLPFATLDLIKERGFNKAIIVGGPAAVSRDVEEQLQGRFPCERVYGDTAVDTSKAIAKWEVERGMGVSPCMGVATADGWQDALSGAALCGSNNCILLLATPDQMQAVNWAVDKFEYNSRGFVFGGPAAVPQSIMSRLLSAFIWQS